MRITRYNGRWVRSLLYVFMLWCILFFISAEDPAAGQETTVIQSSGPMLDIRSEPDLNAAIIGTITGTEAVEVLESWFKIRTTGAMPDLQSEPDLNSETVKVLEGWIKIRKPDGTEGFVYRQYKSAGLPKQMADTGQTKQQPIDFQDKRPQEAAMAGIGEPLPEAPPAGSDDGPESADDPDNVPAGFDDEEGTDDPLPEEAIAGFEDDETSADDGLNDILSGFDDDGGASSDDLADVLSGFDDETSSPGFEPSDTTDSPWDVTGSVKLSTVFNVNHDSPEPGWTDHRGLSRMRPELTLEIDRDLFQTWKFRFSGRAFYDFAYTIQGRDEYTDEVLDEYESEAEIQEAYIQGSLLPSLDLKVGRQIVVWGRSDSFRVTDVLNPLDSRTPGLVDIEDLRLPVCMTKLDYYVGDFTITGIAIPEIRFSKLPVVGNDFYPLNEAQPREVVPGPRLSNTEFAGSIKGIFHGWDASLYGAYFFKDESYYDPMGYRYTLVEAIPLPGGGAQPIYEQDIVARSRHERLCMVGGAANVTSGSWLFKTELAYTSGYYYPSIDDEKTQLKWLVGLEYSGMKNTTVFLDLLQTWINDFETRMMNPPDYAVETQFECAFRISRTFIHERLELAFLGLLRGRHGEDGAFERLSASYDFTDSLNALIGILFYQDGDNIVYDNIHENNRVYLDLTYTF